MQKITSLSELQLLSRTLSVTLIHTFWQDKSTAGANLLWPSTVGATHLRPPCNLSYMPTMIQRMKHSYSFQVLHVLQTTTIITLILIKNQRKFYLFYFKQSISNNFE